MTKLPENMIRTVPQRHPPLPPGIHLMPMDKAMKHLEKIKTRGIDLPDRPDRMETAKIDCLMNLFQARGDHFNDAHVQTLETALREGQEFEPVMLWRAGDYAFLLDGHHRLQATRNHEAEIGSEIGIRVAWFEGDVAEAVVKAAASNTRPKLQMDYTEKSNHAWRMVLAGKERFTRAQIATAADVAERTVSTMRKVAAALGDSAHEATTWKMALAMKNGDGTWDTEEAEARLDLMAKTWADRLAVVFSTHLATHPQATAKAFTIHFGRAAEQVITDWAKEAGIDLQVLADRARRDEEEALEIEGDD